MPPLSRELRLFVEPKVVEARREAESAARAALTALAVDRPQGIGTLPDDRRRLRNALRARARQLGAGKLDAGLQPLVEEVAYEQWHRMLFARFLAENELLFHPEEGVSLDLASCAQLADEHGEGDQWSVAAGFASAMLPGIFRTDDPSAQIRLAPEGQQSLERILEELPPELFRADDGLGWMYQFWQSKKKDEVNKSGRKIGGADLAPVTQLFTEHYMVQFLLENSLGAWWAARHPDSPLVKTFEYLRFKDDGTPAAGTFDGWPSRAAEVTVMDPCCGSGHFLVAAFEMLRRMRMEEGLGEAEAADAVLRDNIFGLELDPRCLQIGAFALALAAWKAGGYRPLPLPNLVCSGIPVSGQLDEWTTLAGNDPDLRKSLERLYELFRNAPDLGSLINPADVPLRDQMFAPDFSKVGPLLERAIAKERAADDPVATSFGAAAKGAARAVELLGRHYTLVATNVPYLGTRKQGDRLKAFIKRQHASARADLAAAFLERCRTFAVAGGSCAVVTPQSWLFQTGYSNFRERCLREQEWSIVVRLGEGAFRSSAAAGAFSALFVVSNRLPSASHAFLGIDASAERTPSEKAGVVRNAPLLALVQTAQLGNPESRMAFEKTGDGRLLEEYAIAPQGMKTGDDDRFRRWFWEVPRIGCGWEFYQSTVEDQSLYGGRSLIIDWSTQGKGMVRPRVGNQALGKPGVAISQMRGLPATIYTGERYDSNVAPLVPKNSAHLAALWAFCSSRNYFEAVRRIDQKIGVTNATLLKVPFDHAHWQELADEMGPIPEPYSNDPTQWLFKGDPSDSTEPLLVAVARLLGYRWPQQEADHLSRLAVQDGIVPLAPVAGVEPAADRLRALLAAAFGGRWSAAQQERLLQQVGFAGKGLDVWLRDGFFEQHCRVFHQRPFIWQIWDGRRDGFSALVNYHLLDGARLEKLTYTYLGGWIRTQRAARDVGTARAEARLVAALELQRKLEAIREGEKPYDIYVRWKPLHQQPIGWEPDLNDGVRLNIRPSVEAGVLRSRVNVKWGKDRGTNPDGSERLNDLHYTLAEKREAREAQALVQAGGGSEA